MNEFSVPLDPRVEMMIAGFDGTGKPVPLAPGHLEARSQQWALAIGVPRDVEEIMHVVRRLYAHAAIVYEFATVAAHYALLSFEAALRHRLPRSPSSHGLAKLIDMAARRASNHRISRTCAPRIRPQGSQRVQPSIRPDRLVASDGSRNNGPATRRYRGTLPARRGHREALNPADMRGMKPVRSIEQDLVLAIPLGWLGWLVAFSASAEAQRGLAGIGGFVSALLVAAALSVTLRSKRSCP